MSLSSTWIWKRRRFVVAPGRPRPAAAKQGNVRAYVASFLVDTRATDTVAPADKLQEIGLRPVGRMAFELRDGSLKEYPYGLGRIEFLGEITAGRVVFGPPGVTALESVGILVDGACPRYR